VSQSARKFIFQFRHYFPRQRFPELHSPLIERPHSPYYALRVNTVLVHGHEFAQRFRSELFHKYGGGRSVAVESLVRYKFWFFFFRAQFFGRFSESQRLRLREHVRHQQIVVPSYCVKRFGKADKIARNQFRALMYKLIKRMLAVGPRFPPVYLSRLVVSSFSAERDALAVAFHGHLLQIGRKTAQILFVRQNSGSLCPEEIAVPYPQQGHYNRNVLFERSVSVMHVHFAETRQHSAEIFRTYRYHCRQPYGGAHGVSSAYPVPESEHIICVYAEFRYGFGVCGKCGEMSGYSRIVAEFFNYPFARRRRVGHGFERCERFRRHYKQRFFRVQIRGRFREVGPVYIRNESESHIASGIIFKRFVRHYRSEIRTAYAYIDDVLNRFSGESFPFSGAYSARERFHFYEHGVNFRHDVFPVHQHRFALGSPQGGMQHRPFFRDVYLLAGEHIFYGAVQS